MSPAHGLPSEHSPPELELAEEEAGAGAVEDVEVTKVVGAGVGETYAGVSEVTGRGAGALELDSTTGGAAVDDDSVGAGAAGATEVVLWKN